MKFAMVFLTIGCMYLASCTSTNVGTTNSDSASLSYAFGVLVGTSLAETHLSIDSNDFIAAVNDVLNKKNLLVTTEKAQEIVQAGLESAKALVSSKNAKEEQAFLETNAKKTGVVSTGSGLQYQIIKHGDGEKPKANDTVTVHYVGSLIDGTVFDSSVERDSPASFPLDGVIPGLSEGIALMQIGSKYFFYVPSKLAYGDQAPGGKIGPNQLLVFEVELISSEDSPAEDQALAPDLN